MIEVSKQEFQQIANQLLADTMNAFKTMTAAEAAAYQEARHKELGQYEVVLKQLPDHENTGIIKLIKGFCDERIEMDNRVLYKGYAGVIVSANYYLRSYGLEGFDFVQEWSNKQRSVYISDEDLATITISGGDVIVSLSESAAAFKEELDHASSFYSKSLIAVPF